MYLTEEEARQKWCPFARVSASNFPEPGNHASNRDAGGSVPSNGSNCLASECMAWRIKRLVGRDEQVAGYCGLVGKPDE